MIMNVRDEVFQKLIKYLHIYFLSNKFYRLFQTKDVSKTKV